MLSDTDVACVAIALALCLANERNRLWNNQWYKSRPQYTNGNPTDLMMSGPNDYKFHFCAFQGFIF
jgi:hypothetical protein